MEENLNSLLSVYNIKSSLFAEDVYNRIQNKEKLLKIFNSELRIAQIDLELSKFSRQVNRKTVRKKDFLEKIGDIFF
jgi:hypothetical protein